MRTHRALLTQTFFGFFLFLTSLLGLPNLSADESTVPAPKTCDIQSQFTKSILKNFDPTIAHSKTGFAFAVIDSKTGLDLCTDFFEADKILYPASSIKTLIAVALLKKIDLKQIKFEDLITINQINAAQECADWGCSVYGPGKQVSIKKLLYDMITVSNNLATNQLIDVIDRNTINQMAEALGTPSLKVNRKVYNIVDPEPQITVRNTATAKGLIDLYREVSTGRLGFLSASSRGVLIDTLKLQHYHETFNFGFPAQYFYYHKPGETSRTISDGGYFYLNPDHIALLVGLLDMPGSQGREPMRRIGKDVLDFAVKLY